MPIFKRLSRYIHTERSQKLVAAAGYSVSFLLLFSTIIGGAGQYWDWSFPLFQSDIANLFLNNAESWTMLKNGTPLSYSSDYFLRMIVALFTFLQPEHLRYILFVAIFSLGSYGGFLIMRRHVSAPVAWLLGLFAMVNIALFYKYTAGHFNYIVSYVVFIYLLYYLFYCYRGRLEHIATVGLLCALSGAQIQFFIFVSIFLLLFAVFRRDVMKWWHLLIIGLITLLGNMVWLTNFVTGAASVSDTAATAAAAGFKGLIAADFIDIFSFSFAKATLLSRFLSSIEFAFYSLLVSLLLWLCIKAKKFDRLTLFSFGFLLVLLFMATGLFTRLPLGPITLVYPMLREVGHFAPIIILSIIVLVAILWPRRGRLPVFAAGLIALLVFIAVAHFIVHNQATNVAKIRSQLAPFEQLQESDQGAYRILAYPFFENYQMLNIEQKRNLGYPLNQAGHDSFLPYSGKEFLNNKIPPDKFKESPQYKLLKTYDVAVLQPYNVKYIYDLSAVYESHYDVFVPKMTYDADKSLIKNDPQFLQKIIDRNPGKVKKINDKILEIMHYTPRVSAPGQLFAFSEAGQAENGSQFTRQLSAGQNTYHIAAQPLPYETNIVPLLSSAAEVKLDTAKGQMSELVPKDSVKTGTELYVAAKTTLFYRLSQHSLTIFTRPLPPLSVNGSSLAEQGQDIILYQLSIEQVPYFIRLGEEGALVRAAPGERRIGELPQGGVVKLYRGAGNNLIANPSFEEGLWKPKVGDCNNYDKQPDIKAELSRQIASHGQRALQLEARRHDACMSTTVKFPEGGQYVLSYDYQSPNAHTTRFYLGYSKPGTPPANGFAPVYGQHWLTASELLQVEPGATSANLFVYALESRSKEPTVNRYDNFSLMKLEAVQDVPVAPEVHSYKKVALPKNQPAYSFTINDNSFDYKNVLQNGAFEQGLWQESVSDCSNYNYDPQIAASLNQTDKAEGRQSLELRATRHDACTFVELPLKPNAVYRLSLKYKAKKGVQYGVTANYDVGSQDVGSKEMTSQHSDWQALIKYLKAPADASSVRLYLYAYESDGITEQSVLYDAVELIEIPRLENQFYLVTPAEQALTQPDAITVTKFDPTRKSVAVKGASGRFLLNVSETFHPGWKLWLGTQSIATEQHLRLNNFSNGWYIDTQKLCEQAESGCVQRKDGRYDMQFELAFAPQQAFLIGRVVSIVSLGACLAFISVSAIRKQYHHRKKE
ncbi:MAG TPA: hypothetical protein VFZ58_02850 [Candidatus Saccharimonadales bacterium]